MKKSHRALALVLVIAVGAFLTLAVSSIEPPFGSFPLRQVGTQIETSVGQQYLENAPHQTGATNVVTSVVWGYRGYDTLGESTVLFTAVVGVLMIFRARRNE
jgi:multisubunit Na+/H+ antiporter MnhB subunit